MDEVVRLFDGEVEATWPTAMGADGAAGAGDDDGIPWDVVLERAADWSRRRDGGAA